VAGELRIARASAAIAVEQAAWIARLGPWRGLGYTAARLGRYLDRKARARRVWVARRVGEATPVGVIVADDGVLLGAFIALLAVRAEAAGQGIGRALVAEIERMTAETRDWLYVSCDATNREALRFYRRLRFSRVGKLPDLIAPGRVEILLRKSIGRADSSPTAPF
jgi:ribosomal protein S18 acetylase RimI-like enzyme